MSVRDFAAAVRTMIAREAAGEYVPERWDDGRFSENEVIAIAAMPAGTTYVNVYAVGREYGGPEEGGWYYDSGELELSLCAPSEAVADMWAALLHAEYQDHGNRYSVLYYRNPQDYIVDVSDIPGESYPKNRPHYE